MIEWAGVSVVFGTAPALTKVSLDVKDGEWVGIIGPNGAGKSTMLKAAVGVVSYSGTVLVSGAIPRAGLDLAWMPQRPVMPEGMSVTDYVALGRSPHLGYLAGESVRDRASVARALDILGLQSFADRVLSTLSGGEAQRVVLARALCQEAPVLLLDEPTANLDVGHAVEVLDAVDGLRDSLGLTVVSAVHDLTLAGRYVDRFALLSGGALVAVGDPASVLTDGLLRSHYGAGMRVIQQEDGPVVIPTRPVR